MEQSAILNPSRIQTREDWREECKSIFYLCKVVLGECWKDKFQDFGKLHEMLCNFLDLKKNPSRKKFISVFRGSYKTTVLIGYVIYLLTWALVNKKPISIVYNTATKENAEAFMEDVRETIRQGVFYRWIFPEGLPDPKDNSYKRWSMKKIEYKWVKFHVASLDTRQVSRHYQVLINDDLVNDDNAHSDVERGNIKRKWRYQKSIITRYKKHKIGLEIDVGTPFDSRDLISYITKKVKSYDKFIMPYALPDSLGRLDLEKEYGILTFPEMFVWEDYKELREEQGESIFSTQYELKCPEEGDLLCKEEWIKHWRFLPESYTRYMVIDPAGTDDKQHNCPTGIVVCDVNPAGTIFILHAGQYWITPKELIDLMDEMREFYDPDEIFVEKEKYSITIADTMEHLAPKLNFSFVMHDNQPKEKRILRLKQWFETGRILFGEGMKELENQALSYPDCNYVDMLDALAYVLKVMIPPKRGIKRSATEESEDEFEAELSRITALHNIADRSMYDDLAY